jgi:hypothetical protein
MNPGNKMDASKQLLYLCIDALNWTRGFVNTQQRELLANVLIKYDTRIQTEETVKHWRDILADANWIVLPQTKRSGGKLPKACTCNDCMNHRRCSLMFGRINEDIHCDWTVSAFISRHRQED